MLMLTFLQSIADPADPTSAHVHCEVTREREQRGARMVWVYAARRALEDPATSRRRSTSAPSMLGTYTHPLGRSHQRIREVLG
jgi:hypothetical protein